VADVGRGPMITLSEAIKRKRQSDQVETRRVNIEPAFIRWSELREITGCKTDVA